MGSLNVEGERRIYFEDHYRDRLPVSLVRCGAGLVLTGAASPRYVQADEFLDSPE